MGRPRRLAGREPAVRARSPPHSWGTFFRFNAARGADWDSLWFVVVPPAVGANGGSCGWSAGAINLASLAIFVVAGARRSGTLRRHRLPEIPAWTLGFPLIALFLLTNKVYSPQYGLWLLPWFALALPSRAPVRRVRGWPTSRCS